MSFLPSDDGYGRDERRPWPLGATLVESQGGFNFALYSRHAVRVTLLMYGEHDPANPVQIYELDPILNKTGLMWHCSVPDRELHGANLYAYRIGGHQDPSSGHRFDPQKVVLDSFAMSVYFPPEYSRSSASQPGPTDGKAPLWRLLKDPEWFEWGADVRPRNVLQLIVCELHVKGFTARPNSGVNPGKRGTFAGLIQMIPYLKDLGITVVELLPVHQYDPQESNYRGYMTFNFFSPHHDYALGEPACEFREMVTAFRAGGIEVWLEVVYNHTSESGAEGPVEVYRPYQSVNFINAHDGFCLYDPVAYNEKHDEANGHNNTDGTNDNLSWNCGWEGDAGVSQEIMALRRQQIKNFFCLLMLANGTPLFCAGDEFINTQRGNNNPHNQDNEITWLDWDLLEHNRDMFRFFKCMVEFRKSHPSIGRGRYWREDVKWYGTTGRVDLSRDSGSLAYFLRGSRLSDNDLYVLINACWEELRFTIQEGQAE